MTAKPNKKHPRGFTLLEVIVSIAALAIMSVFIVQMFIVSHLANERAKYKDIASGLAMSSVESFKACRNAADFLESEFMWGAHIKMGNGEETLDFIMAPDSEESYGIDFTETVSAFKYYDASFQPVEGHMEDNPTEEATSEQVRFIQVFYIYAKSLVDGYTFNGGSQESYAGEMINIKTYIMDMEADFERNQLVSYSSKKYFPYRGAVGEE